MVTREKRVARAGRLRRLHTRARPPVRAPERRRDLEAMGAAWWSALDAAESALRAAASTLTERDLRELRTRLSHERAATVALLEDVARAERSRARFSQLLVSRSNLRRLLRLPSYVTACVFNLDGVLIGSAALHAAAWAETFDPFLLERSERTGGRFAPFDRHAPFDPRTDYWEHIHSRPRLEGVRAFLASRGISLPDGEPTDTPGAETVHGLANRKREALLRRLEQEGVRAFEGSRRYLECAREAGVRRAVISASANTDTLLERAGLATLIDERVDGAAIVAERLRPRPEPDLVLAACRRLGVEPGQAAVFETNAAGVAAARSAGVGLVVGVDPLGHGRALRSAGADLVAAGLAELLEPVGRL
jgi:HAD superfamily hydrolase (TIGR01509 family)